MANDSPSYHGPRVRLTVWQLIERFNEGLAEAQVFQCLSRSARLQLAACRSLDVLMRNAFYAKSAAIDAVDEDAANLFLGFECCIGAARSELVMWVLLKQERSNEAWDWLIAAQMACTDAMRAHRGFAGHSQNLARLQTIEELNFPSQVFLSAGLLSRKIDCSICGERYAACEHLRGLPYLGRFCEVVHRNPRADHVAIVDAPADKRCRVTSFKTETGHRDRLSWEVSPYAEGEEFDGVSGLEVSSILLALDRFPYLRPIPKVLLGSG